MFQCKRSHRLPLWYHWFASMRRLGIDSHQLLLAMSWSCFSKFSRVLLHEINVCEAKRTLWEEENRWWFHWISIEWILARWKFVRNTSWLWNTGNCLPCNWKIYAKIIFGKLWFFASSFVSCRHRENYLRQVAIAAAFRIEKYKISDNVQRLLSTGCEPYEYRNTL